MERKKYILHLRSGELESKPLASDVKEGELVINNFPNHEKIFLKNTNSEIVPFISERQIMINEDYPSSVTELSYTDDDLSDLTSTMCYFSLADCDITRSCMLTDVQLLKPKKLQQYADVYLQVFRHINGKWMRVYASSNFIACDADPNGKEYYDSFNLNVIEEKYKVIEPNEKIIFSFCNHEYINYADNTSNEYVFSNTFRNACNLKVPTKSSFQSAGKFTTDSDVEYWHTQWTNDKYPIWQMRIGHINLIDTLLNIDCGEY